MADFSEQEMLADLDAADAAGDTQLAQHIAGLIKQKRAGGGGASPVAAGPPPPTPPGMLSARPTAATNARELDPSANMPVGHNLVEGFGSFLPRTGLAIRRGAASLGYGDKADTDAEAAEQEKINKPLFDTTGGATGKMLPEFALSMAGGVGPTAAKQFLGNVGTGAVMNALDPEGKDYDLLGRLGVGGGIGGLADLAGRTISRAVKPFRKFSPGSVENTKILSDAGLPKPLASTEAGGGFAVPMSQALEQIPGISAPMKKALDENAEWFTRKMSKDAGMEVSHITDSTRRAISDRLDTVATGLRQLARPVDEKLIKDSIEFAKLTMAPNLAAVSKKGVVKQFDNAIEALTPGAHLSPEDLLKRRSIATDSMYTADSAVEKAAFKSIRDAYDEAYVHANPHLKDLYETWRSQYGSFKDLIKAADKGLGRGDTILPANMRAVSDFGEGVAKTQRERLIQAAAQQMPTPPGGWNRAGYIAMLLGAPLGTGAITKTLGGDWDATTGIGGATAASLVHGLSRKPVSQSTANLIRALTTAGVIGGGT
jgi:hypothetical protein